MTNYGSALKTWRSSRRLSQLELATVADVSQRHVSFLETGRAKPSREMVIHLAIALDVPLRERNTMLAAAGYAPEYSETPLSEPALEQVRGVLERIITSHEPFPAIVVDRCPPEVRSEGPAQQLPVVYRPRLHPVLIELGVEPIPDCAGGHRVRYQTHRPTRRHTLRQ